MWKRRELKQNAKAILKHNYLRAVIVCLIMAFFVGAYYHTFSGLETRNKTNAPELQNAPNSQIVNRFIYGILSEVSPQQELIHLAGSATGAENADKGVLAGIFNNVTQAGSFIFGLLNAFNQAFFRDRIWPSIIILLGALLNLAYWLFIGNTLHIGECRFFLESKLYPATEVRRLLYIYKIRRVPQVAIVMLLRAVYIGLWSLTIVGGPIKAYAYRMVPYLLAENPDLGRREIFRLSSELMRGQKWRTFVMDLTFLPWDVLTVITLGFVGFLFVNPYRAATMAELYRHLRQQAVARGLAPQAFHDPYLYELPAAELAPETPPGHYPVALYPLPEHPGRKWLGNGYHRHYSLRTLVLLFFSYCMIGWLWEVCYFLFGEGIFANRGFLLGPWLPIYGTGGILMLLLLRKWIDRPVALFCLAVTLCGVMEYVTGWALYELKGVRWWDYSGFFLNLNGFICLEGLLTFGIGGCASIYFLAPTLDNLYKKIPLKLQTVLCILLLALFSTDLAISFQNPNQGEGVTSGCYGQQTYLAESAQPEKAALAIVMDEVREI